MGMIKYFINLVQLKQKDSHHAVFLILGFDEHTPHETKEDTITQNNTETQTLTVINKTDLEEQARKDSVLTLLECSRICPFKWTKNLYFCIYCEESFADPAKLRKHTFAEHDNIRPEEIKQKLILIGRKRHEFLKTDITDLSCKLCDTTIISLDNLKAHLIEKHKKKINLKSHLGILPFKINIDDYKCVICDEKYGEYKTLNHHMNVHFQNYICEQCGSGFITPARLRVHCFTHETGSFPCSDCNKVFRSSNANKEHYADVHLKVKRHRCPQCPETFRNYFQRTKHISIVHGVKMKEFKCEYCPKVFHYSGKMAGHIRYAHLKEKRHGCDLCDWKFYSPYELKQHMIKHGGERKYQCNVCKKAYARKYTLREHMRIHENDRRFVCTVCGKTFVQACSLKHHFRVHHPKAPPVFGEINADVIVGL